MARDAQRLLGFVLAIGAVGLTLAVLGGRLLGFAAGPEVELITQLKRAERGVDLPVPPYGTLVSAKLQYQRLSVIVDEPAHTAIVTGTLDFTGVFNRDVQVSSLGLEKIAFVFKDGEWQPSAGVAPRLVAIVQALEVRRRRIEAGDFATEEPDAGDPLETARFSAMTRRVYRSDAWYIRSEREEVEVAEDYRLTGDTPDRPIDEKATKRLTLHEDRLGRFFFPRGLL